MAQCTLGDLSLTTDAPSWSIFSMGQAMQYVKFKMGGRNYKTVINVKLGEG